MRKFPSKRILLPATAILLVLLVLGVVFWARPDQGRVELIVQDVVDWETNRTVRVTVVLTNGTSRTVGVPKNSWGGLVLAFVNESAEWRLIVKNARGLQNPPYEKFSPHQSITNTAILLVQDLPLRQTTSVRTKYKDLKVEGIVFLEERFPRLLPKRVADKWGRINEERIYSDWITPTGALAELPPP